MTGHEPCWLGVGDLARLFASGATTPSRHLEYVLARIDALDGQLHSFVHIDRAGARDAAMQATRAMAAGRAIGPLHGVPIGIKDVIDVCGMPTRCHSRLMSHDPVDRDAWVVQALRQAGAVIVGKLATHEFAIGGPAFDLPFPPARNPWNPGCHPGGSSSGAGAAVAAGLIPAAIGTDTAGSVRNPASACGIVGLKPGYGLLPCDGVFPLAPSLDHLGIVTRSVGDAALMLAALRPQSVSNLTGDALTGLRVGFVRHFHETDMIADAETGAALAGVAAALAQGGANVSDIALPPLDRFAVINRVLLQSEGFAIHADNLRKRPEAFASLTRAALLPGAFTTSEDYRAAQCQRAALTAAVNAAFATTDILLCASSMEPACAIDAPDAIARTYMRNARAPFNVTGHPALAMMAGLSQGGLPLSVQFAGRHGEESRLLGVAQAWQTAMGGPIHPPI
jgi:aspartyl-tRNA(Asn)/glutamyl-tRNA(Gln) amidotransferase subunit A